VQIQVDVIFAMSLLSLGLSAFNVIFTQRRLGKTDTRESAETTTKILVKLDNIEKFMTKNDVEMNIIRRDYQELRDMVITNGQSVKSAHHRIDRIEGQHGPSQSGGV